MAAVYENEAACHTRRNAFAKPRARALDGIEGGGRRASKDGEPGFQVRELCQQRLGFDVGRVGCRGAALETALDPTQTLGLVDGEAKQPAIPVAERNAVDLAPWIGALARAVVERHSVGSLGRSRRRVTVRTTERRW